MENDKLNISYKYVSEIDNFISAFDTKEMATSDARRFEEEKYKRIHFLRDNEEQAEEQGLLWKDF